MLKRAVRFLSSSLIAVAVLASPAGAATRTNVLVVMTDDQRVDAIDWMPNLTALAAQGVRFTRAFHPTPLCGPSRVSMFSGGFYAKNTGVLENTLPNGGIQLFDDSRNFGLVMQQAGYETYFVGKWVNEHYALENYVPPGWTRFIGRLSNVLDPDWSHGLEYVIGSSRATSTAGSLFELNGQYITHYERDRILQILDRAGTERPFFVFWSPAAPHRAATPASRDEDLFANYLYRGRGYGEVDLSDKPKWVRSNSRTAVDDEFIRKQLRSVQSVDRSIAAIVEKLRTRGQPDDTMIVFTSDNGFQWGEHNFLWTKPYPYVECVRAPLVIVMPGVKARTDNHLVAASLDLAPTLYDLAGTSGPTEGRSLLPILRNPASPWRQQLFLEAYGTRNIGEEIWAGVIRGKWKYVRYWRGEEELYDLDADPYELQSRHADPALATLKAGLAADATRQLGLAIMPPGTLPSTNVGTAYQYLLRSWGGKAPLKWQLASGHLPPGIQLDVNTGALRGTPSSSGRFTFRVRVTDSSLATQAGRARTFVSGPLTIDVRS